MHLEAMRAPDGAPARRRPHVCGRRAHPHRELVQVRAGRVHAAAAATPASAACAAGRMRGGISRCSTRPDRAPGANPGELPARVRRKEIAVRRAQVRLRRRAAAAAQHVLVAHELAVVLADRARRPARKPGYGRVVAARPLPHVAVDLRGCRRGGAPSGARQRMQRAGFEEVAGDRLLRARRAPTRTRSAAARPPSARRRRPRRSSRGTPACCGSMSAMPCSVNVRHASPSRSQYSGASQPRACTRVPARGQPQLGARDSRRPR